jgi:SAM-dependent methyltransferase
MLTKDLAMLLLTALALLAAPMQADPAQADPVPGAARPGESFEPVVGQPGKDVVWVPTPDAVVQAMLDMANVGADDYVVDLGSGDGKIAIAAARRGARALGIEYNPKMVEISKRNAEAAGVDNVRFVQGDIFESDFSAASVVTLYLLPSLNERLRPILLRMKPGTRVASHQFTMGDWKADRTTEVGTRQALMWVVPAQVAGRWELRIDGEEQAVLVKLDQQYQHIRGDARWGLIPSSPLREAALVGGRIDFKAADAGGAVHRFVGTADHDGRMSGVVTDGGGRERAFSGTRLRAQ